jgi:hypothetical protein
MALNSAALNGSRAVGPAIAGTFITLVGTGGSYFLQAAMYLFATIWTIQIHVPPRAADHAARISEPILRSMRAGVGYVAHQPNIRSLMLLALGPLTFGMSYNSLMPVMAKDVLHGGASLQGLLLTMIGVGSLSGALVVASWRRNYGYGLPVVLGATAFSVAIFAFGSSHWIPVSLALGFVLGLTNVSYTTQNQTLLQVITPRHMRGRVMSIWLLDRGFVPMAALLAGFLASHFGAPHTLQIMSLVSLCIVALVVVSSPQFLKMKVPFRDEGALQVNAIN